MVLEPPRTPLDRERLRLEYPDDTPESSRLGCLVAVLVGIIVLLTLPVVFLLLQLL
jgi:hypothetical protein